MLSPSSPFTQDLLTTIRFVLACRLACGIRFGRAAKMASVNPEVVENTEAASPPPFKLLWLKLRCVPARDMATDPLMTEAGEGA